ncbi:terminase small subunit [Paenibacillus tarimensis]
MKLPAMQKKFADEYLIDLNATAAYKRAGYKATGSAATAAASRLLTNVNVQAYIQERMKEREKRTEITQDRVLKEYAKLGFFDARKLFNPDGSPVPITELDDETAAAIAGLEVMEVWEGHGDNRTFIGYLKKYKITDKKGALDSIARHLGMFNDKIDLSGVVVIKGESDLRD